MTRDQRWPWEPSDIYYVGQSIDTHGDLTVVFRRGALVEKVQVPASSPDVEAAAMRAVRRLHSVEGD